MDVIGEQGITVSLTFDSNTVFTASTSWSKLKSLLEPNKKLLPSHIISILSFISGLFFNASAIFVKHPIASIYVFLFLLAISIILLIAGFVSLYPFFK